MLPVCLQKVKYTEARVWNSLMFNERWITDQQVREYSQTTRERVKLKSHVSISTTQLQLEPLHERHVSECREGGAKVLKRSCVLWLSLKENKWGRGGVFLIVFNYIPLIKVQAAPTSAVGSIVTFHSSYTRLWIGLLFSVFFFLHFSVGS